MSDLVSRSELLEAYDKAHVGPPGGARKLIEEAPAVDAVPVEGMTIEKVILNTGTNEVAVVVLTAGKERILLKNHGKIRKSEKLEFRRGARLDGGNDESD